MGLRGIKPKGRVKIKWSANFAYAIGLIATDGCLQRGGRYIELTSKDREQLRNFLKALNITVPITYKQSSLGLRYLRVQFGDVLFGSFLMSIGLTPRKSKTLGEIKIPSRYFFDFLRGSHDGDGCFYSYYDPRWKSSFMFYTVFVSASRAHLDWIRRELKWYLDIKGHVTGSKKSITYQLKYAKGESLKLLPKMYYNSRTLCLSRKKQKIERALVLNRKNYARVEKLVNSLP